ncbi:MAG: cell division protein FtsZ [Candidatus Odinarchaeota archaeon]
MRTLIKSALSKARVEDYSKEDSEIETTLRGVKAKIAVIGVGGAGNNTVTRLKLEGVEGAETIAVNTDAQDLLHTVSDHKILLGKQLTKGLGAGNDPKIGQAAAKEAVEELREAVKADMVFVTCGLGGGTGTGAAPVIAELAKEEKALTVSIVTLPFKAEGVKREANARWGLEQLINVSDSVIIIPNDKILEIAPELSIPDAFRLADEILIGGVKGITELIFKPGLINLDFADVRKVMVNRGTAIIGMAESASNNSAIEAVELAVSNPLLDVDISTASAALINLCGGPNLTIKQAEEAISCIAKRISRDAEIIWGTIIEQEMGKLTRATVILSGLPPFNNYASSVKTDKKVINKSVKLALDEL